MRLCKEVRLFSIARAARREDHGDKRSKRDNDCELLADGAPIDSFGVGTELATSFDAPAPAVYKMVGVAERRDNRYAAKYSADKQTSRLQAGVSVC